MPDYLLFLPQQGTLPLGDILGRERSWDRPVPMTSLGTLLRCGVWPRRSGVGPESHLPHVLSGDAHGANAQTTSRATTA